MQVPGVNRSEASDNSSMDFLLLPGPSHWRPCAPAPTASVGAAVSEMNSTSLELLYVTMQCHGRRLPTIHTNCCSWNGPEPETPKKISPIYPISFPVDSRFF